MGSSLEFVESFTTPECDCAVELWPLGSKEKLKTESTTLYDYSMRRQPCLCYHPSTKTNLDEAFAQTVRLLKVSHDNI